MTDNANVIELHKAATELLNHLEDVLDDKNIGAIDHRLWNAVSMFLVNKGIKVDKLEAPPPRDFIAVLRNWRG